MFMGWCVGEGFIPPGMLAAAETSAGVRQTRVYGQPPGRACPAPTARLWGRCYLYCIRRAACPHAAEGPRGRLFNGLPRKVAAACGQAALRAPFLWPPVQRMVIGSAPSVVGGGVPDAPRVYGKPAFTGSHRAGHARPLPRGFGADVTCITAVGRHAPMPPKVRVATRLTGCRARPRRRGQDPSLRTNVHGCFVGSGLDRSVPVCGKRAVTGSHRAGHARPLPRGFGADITCITAVGRHAYPIASAISASVRVLRTGCGSPPPSCRTITQ